MMISKPVLVVPLAAVMFLSACENAGQRERIGAGTGAVAGGILGGALGGSAGTAAAGAVGGAIVGGMIGSQLDEQAGELRGAFDDDRIGVVNTGSSLVVTMPQDILFATDSAELTGSLRSDLGVLAQHLNKYEDSNVQVVGHTDNTGSANYNLNLSRQRAAAVANTLIGNGVSSSRITATGRGEDQPVASNLTAEGRAQNRRVEVVIVPVT
ncbi:OmpA family protein [Maritimibacter sp. HL-12]|jgi:outer membrane protein OmpA-like peptidoglycan-associated protein|uniref:OmpA family protein n=1 Tax=Maritimibacter sp. HL-12 TaxID=1162418 RepID=UPI000A1C9A99|nr:OmpA family protein [Maritimibacter sp. HL-12]